MENLELLIDLHIGHHRQGPGSDEDALKALNMTGLDDKMKLKIADIGCGTGAGTLLLADKLNAEIYAVDFLKPFLDEMMLRANKSGVAEKIKPLAKSMDELDFAVEELDLLWSEGAIYNIGFENGIRIWKKFLKPGGHIVLSEITWLTKDRPLEITEHWLGEYPEIDLASNKIRILEDNDFELQGYFTLPEKSWIDNYYRPIIDEFDSFLERNNNVPAAIEIVESEKHEIELYNKYKKYLSYGFYIARKVK